MWDYIIVIWFFPITFLFINCPIGTLYKIITTINLCEELSHKYPKFNFIPVYWMATEDHDFKEINHFNFENTKIEWESNQTGVVGEFLTAELKTVLDELIPLLEEAQNYDYYYEINTLAEKINANELYMRDIRAAGLNAMKK